MTLITLREHGPVQWVPLTAHEVGQLEATAAAWKRTLGLPSSPLTFEWRDDLVGVSAGGVAGVMRVGDVNVEIAPKFLDPDHEDARDWRRAFWSILVIAQDGKSVLGRALGADANAESIADLLTEIFLRSHARGSTRGMPLRYTELMGDAPSVRGAFHVARFGDWMARPWAIPTSETVLTTDTPLARLLAWAAAQLRTLTASKARARELDVIRQGLPGPGWEVPRLDVAERIQLGVQHEALRPAFEVALLLLRGHGVRHGEGNRDVIGFLWRSDDIYERFLSWLCDQAARSRGLLGRKASARFGISESAPPLTTTPDVLFSRRDGTSVAVLDAKYKILNATPRASDSYQVLASANHFGCTEVGLVYPRTRSTPPVRWRIASALGGRDVTIAALHLDLLEGGTVAGRRQLVDTIGDWLDGLGPRVGATHLEASAP